MGTDLAIPDIERTLRDLVLATPAGKVTTYRALAEALGDPESSGFIARWLASPEAEGLPVHRVVHASGAVGRIEGETLHEAAAQLGAEGVRVVGGRVDPLARYFTWQFSTDLPLARLQQEQVAVGERYISAPLPFPNTVGALGVAYAGREAVAAFVLATPEGEVLQQLTIRTPLRFPYISTYLAYRELPACLAAVEAADGEGWRSDVVLVSGNGTLHPRRAGLATHLGVLLDRPTVGVARGHLCGHANTEGMSIGEWRPVILDEDTVGAALRTDRNQTLFVSPGHRCDVDSAVELVQHLTEVSPIPAALQWAHELATEAAQSSRRPDTPDLPSPPCGRGHG